MTDEIVLDKKTFEALAMDTRVKILKALKERRKTQSELSKELNLAVSTVSQHLDKLGEANLVKRKRQGKKWVYYELTMKGDGVLSPKATGVFVFALSVSLFLIVFGSMSLFSTMSSPMFMESLGATDHIGGADITRSGSEIMGEDPEDLTTIPFNPDRGDEIAGSAGSTIDTHNKQTIEINSNDTKDYTENTSDENATVDTEPDMYIAGYMNETALNFDSVIVILLGFVILVGAIVHKVRK